MCTTAVIAMHLRTVIFSVILQGDSLHCNSGMVPGEDSSCLHRWDSQTVQWRLQGTAFVLNQADLEEIE